MSPPGSCDYFLGPMSIKAKNSSKTQSIYRPSGAYAHPSASGQYSRPSSVHSMNTSNYRTSSRSSAAAVEKHYQRLENEDYNYSEELIRIFNTALVSSQANENRDFSTELYQIVETSAFKALLHSIRHHAETQGLTEKQAAEQIILTFRKIDRLWKDYVFHEGIEKLRNPQG